MPRTLTITDANIQQEMLIYKRDTDVVARVGYELVTAQGDIIQRARDVVLTGAAKTRAATLFQDIKDAIKTAEGY